MSTDRELFLPRIKFIDVKFGGEGSPRFCVILCLQNTQRLLPEIAGVPLPYLNWMNLYPGLEITVQDDRSFFFIFIFTVECSLFISNHILILEIAIWETEMKERGK